MHGETSLAVEVSRIIVFRQLAPATARKTSLWPQIVLKIEEVTLTLEAPVIYVKDPKY